MNAILPHEAGDKSKLAFFRGLKRGFFVEVGANHARVLSQTWPLEQRDWSGILIEPQPDLAEDLRRQRSADVYAVACSSRQRAGSYMTLHLAGPHSSFDRNLNTPEIKPEGAIEVPVRTLDDILTEAKAPRIDFISIDVEGHELDMLDGFDLVRWQPRLLVIEDLLLHWRVHRYLVNHGYRWFRRVGIDNWYVPKAAPVTLRLYEKWQFFNKIYLGTPFRRLRMAWRRHSTVPKAIAR